MLSLTIYPHGRTRYPWSLHSVRSSFLSKSPPIGRQTSAMNPTPAPRSSCDNVQDRRAPAAIRFRSDRNSAALRKPNASVHYRANLDWKLAWIMQLQPGPLWSCWLSYSDAQACSFCSLGFSSRGKNTPGTHAGFCYSRKLVCPLCPAMAPKTGLFLPA